jgi:tRNA pseudouridine38-40 synthase
MQGSSRGLCYTRDMPKWKLVIEYQGTRYSGWQEQANARTIQGELRKAAENFFESTVDLGGAGRTDAGVHALAQVAHLKTIKPMPAHRLQHELNDRLPADICVRSITEVPNRFHARHDAVERYYIYQIATRRTAFAKPFVWWIKDKLDVDRMQDCAKLLIGRHDFVSFTESPSQQASTIVEVTYCELASIQDLVLFRIGGSHFLWKMVRRIIGTLVEVGRGQLSIDEFHKLLTTKSSVTAKWTAPPSGLFLELVRYANDPGPGELSPAVHIR